MTAVISIETWMRESNTANPLSNLARVNALMASVMGELVNKQKLVVEEIAAKIKRVSELNTRIKSFSDPKNTQPDAVAPLGTSALDSLAILKEMEALGVPNMKFWFDKLNSQTNAPTVPLIVNNSILSTFSLQLQNISESLQNVSQQESLRLQTLTNRYTQATDQASSVLQKDGQNKGTVTNNLRGSGG